MLDIKDRAPLCGAVQASRRRRRRCYIYMRVVGRDSIQYIHIEHGAKDRIVFPPHRSTLFLSLRERARSRSWGTYAPPSLLGSLTLHFVVPSLSLISLFF